MRSTSGRRRRRREGGRKTRTAPLIPLVILSGSLETGALVRQLREGRAGNKPADFPLHHSSAHYSALTPTILCLLYLFFFSPCVLFLFSFRLSVKAQKPRQENKKRCPPNHLPSCLRFGLPLEQQEAAFKVQSRSSSRAPSLLLTVSVLA